MATYTNIQGQNILIVSSDPANPTIGQIWYNTTSNTLKAFATSSLQKNSLSLSTSFVRPSCTGDACRRLCRRSDRRRHCRNE